MISVVVEGLYVDALVDTGVAFSVMRVDLGQRLKK